jgi:hypothetical protein
VFEIVIARPVDEEARHEFLALALGVDAPSHVKRNSSELFGGGAGDDQIKEWARKDTLPYFRVLKFLA